jgi:hypothetical protein
MAYTTRVVKVEIVGPPSTKVVCVGCLNEIDLTLGHFGRAMKGFIGFTTYDVKFRLNNGVVIKQETFEDKTFPKKVKGDYCQVCYEVLWNISWHDKTGRLRRAFEPLIREVVQPINDDYDASSITKGLYAPHTSRAAQRPNDYEHRPIGSKQSKAAIEEKDIKKDNLVGFRHSTVTKRVVKVIE